MPKDDRNELIKLLFAQPEPNYQKYKKSALGQSSDINLKNILTLLKQIDDDCRTDFSARFYTTGYDKAGYNEIGIIANCTLVGRALLRILYYLDGIDYEMEEVFEDALKQDIELHKDLNDKLPQNVFEMIEFMAEQESTFGDINLLTETFTTEVTFRGNKWGHSTYNNTITHTDVWTLKRIWLHIYGKDDNSLFPRIPVATEYI